MAKVFSAIPGGEYRVDTYGTATEMIPVEVPAAAAEDLRRDPRLRVEEEKSAPRLARKAALPVKDKED